MDKFCLGIIGRCLSLQPWTPISDLYHRQLKIKLKQDDILLQVSLAGRSDLVPYERMQILHKKKPLNGVLYHMPLIEPTQTLFYSKEDHLGKRCYSLHPYFFKRFFVKKEIYRAHDSIHMVLSYRKNRNQHNFFEEAPQTCHFRKFMGIPLHKVNLLAGKLCGLNRWDLQYERECFEKLRKLCLDLNIPLFVLGPMPKMDTFKEKYKLRAFQKIQKFYQKQFAKHEIPYYFPDSIYDDRGNSLYKKDEVHLNSLGHSFLAKELYPIFVLWIRSILENSKYKS